MRILWISHLVPYPPKAGVLIRSYNLVRELGVRHDVDLIMLNQPRLLGDYYETQEQGLAEAKTALQPYVKNIDVLDIPAERSKWSRLRLAMTGLISKHGYTVNWLRNPEVGKLIQQRTADTNYDVVHFDTISLDIFRDDLSCDDVTLLLDHHNIESHMMNRRAEKEPNAFKKFYFKQEYRKLLNYERRIVGEYDGHIVCSEDDRLRLLEVCATTDVRVIPNGIRIDGDFPARNPQPGRLLFIGGLGWYPNEAAVRDFIENIAPILRARNVDFHFDIIGSSASALISELAKRHDDVTLHGYVDSIAPFYEQASAFVCPINDGGGTKLKVLDAMANRTPLVAYELACEGIEVKNATHALITKDPESFADAVEEVFKDPEAAQQMADRGRALVESDYEYDRIGDAISDYYELLASARTSARQNPD
ncbi:MAG: glycosyltransferase family 4 protein [Pseudomonadota bacterium]